ncbi:PilZ domain-containing protein [Niallia sp. 01092]|uniref:PilZ domain-containing protein n=1 Tax=unclassified Niallia TaxID=2837522 RepID=UPI003FD31237
MRYKRDEPFRFQFKEPIEATFTFHTTDNTSLSKPGNAEIIDLSPNGLKFISELDLPVNNEHLLFCFTFKLNNKEFIIPGNIIWKKPRLNQFLYGYEGKNDEGTKKRIVEMLKEYVKYN